MDIQQILLTSLAAIVTALVGAAVAFIKAYTKKMISRIDDEELREKISVASEEMFSAFAEISQTMVPEVRKAAADGKIDANEREGLRKAALAKFKNRYSQKRLDDLRARLGLDEVQFEDWLIGLLESHVLRHKMEMKKAE